MTIVPRLVPPLTDRIARVSDGAGVRPVEPEVSGEFRRRPIVGRLGESSQKRERPVESLRRAWIGCFINGYFDYALSMDRWGAPIWK